MLVLCLPDTPAMRRLLDSLAAHVHDDEGPFFEGEAQDQARAEAEGLNFDTFEAEPKLMAEACDQFYDIVTATLHPDTLTWHLEAE